MRTFGVILMFLCVVSISQAIILDFELPADLNDWSVYNGTVEQSSTVATSGTYSMKYTLSSDNYWGLRWDAPEVPTEFGIVKIDITRYVADWTDGQWTNIGQALALLSDGPSGWVEYNPIAVIDRTTGTARYEGPPLATATDWGTWDGDAEWTIVYDCSGYDGTDATYFAFQLATNCNPLGPGISYIDNILFPEPAPRNPNPTDAGLGALTTDLSWTNAIEDTNSVTVWFAETPVEDPLDPNTILGPDTYTTLLSQVYYEAYPGATSTCPNANIGTLTEGQEYTWCVETEPNTIPLGSFWTFTATANQAPIAAAGADQDLYDPNVVCTLDGSASSDDGLPNSTLTYTWTQIPTEGGPTVTIDDPNAAITTVTLSELANSVEYWNEPTAMYYEFELTVDDGQAQDTDTVRVTLSTDSCVASVEAGGYYFYGDIASATGAGYENRDCKVDLYDFAEMALNWLNCSNTIEGCN